jgi:hypothetical protein
MAMVSAVGVLFVKDAGVINAIMLVIYYLLETLRTH